MTAGAFINKPSPATDASVSPHSIVRAAPATRNNQNNRRLPLFRGGEHKIHPPDQETQPKRNCEQKEHNKSLSPLRAANRVQSKALKLCRFVPPPLTHGVEFSDHRRSLRGIGRHDRRFLSDPRSSLFPRGPALGPVQRNTQHLQEEGRGCARVPRGTHSRTPRTHLRAHKGTTREYPWFSSPDDCLSARRTSRQQNDVYWRDCGPGWLRKHMCRGCGEVGIRRLHTPRS